MLWSRFVNKKQGANKAQRKVETLSQKLSAEIITENYRIVFQSRRKCEIYRDTGVSKKYMNQV